jgi:L-lactate utilization protein LutC
MVSGDGRLYQRFAKELAAVGGEARRVSSDRLADAVASFAHGCASVVIDTDLGDHRAAVEEGLDRAGCEQLAPGRQSSSGADLGVTSAVLGVASTGSVLLASGSGRHRTTGLLPPAHLVVLSERQLVPGFEELFERMPDLARNASDLVLSTGPSRTSDIEMTPVLGVHGPERAIVLVVSS